MSMDFREERYVRVYTRKTVEWNALVWEAKAVHALLLMECDRAGIIAVPPGPRRIRMLAKTIDVPEDVVRAGVADLLADGRVVETEVGFVWPNFIEAQETPASPKHRAKEYRARKREARAAAALSGIVTKRDGAVTKRNATAHPYRTVPTSTEASAVAAPGAASKRGRVVVVENRQDPSPIFSTTTLKPPKAAAPTYEGKLELGEREQAFVDAWNTAKSDWRSSSRPETPTRAQLELLVEMLDHAEYVASKTTGRPEDAENALGLLISGILADPKFNSKRLASVVNRDVWEERLGSAFANMSIDREQRAQRRRW